MKWYLPDLPEYEYGKPPPVWLYVVMCVVIFVVGAVMTVLTWPQGKPVVSEDFFIRLLLLPALLGGSLCAALYIPHERWRSDVRFWNALCKLAHVQWKHWTHGQVVILRSLALTPEPELAERLLGLEGSAPSNPGETLSLKVGAHDGKSRLEYVLEQLLSPFVRDISRICQHHSLDVVLQSGSEHHLTELRALWQRLKLPGLARIKLEPFDAKEAIIHEWFEEREMPDFVLVLACQLHESGEKPLWSEAAVGMLMAKPSAIARYSGKIRPQARIFRPIPSTPDAVLDAVKALIKAEQTPVDRIKHLWMSDLTKQGHNASIAAVRDAGLTLAVHAVDDAIGRPGPVNALLLQTLAAQMVQHGQGTQLIASPSAEGLRLNVVGMQEAPVEEASDFMYPPCLASFTMALIFGWAFFMFLAVETGGLNPMLFWVSFGLVILTFVAQIALAFWEARKIGQRFTTRLRHSSAEEVS
ncbi:hypothetical protein OKW43_006927 [Paraburkholderia sp. WC7.3g]|uniref:hypothetical protein n=1 Tax=Paraburkholderia sp. WC7.3g TaxID=2991070 RepID=UPI003D19567F